MFLSPLNVYLPLSPSLPFSLKSVNMSLDENFFKIQIRTVFKHAIERNLASSNWLYSFLNSLSEHGSRLKSKSLKRAVKILQGNRAHVSHPLFPAPCIHTHLFFYLFSSTIQIHWHHPSLPLMIYSIVFLPHNSIQDNCFLSTVCQALSLQSSVLRVILERSHLGFYTVSNTKVWSQNPINSTSENITPNFPDLPPYCLAMVLALLISHPGKCSSLTCFLASIGNPFPHQGTHRPAHELMQRSSMASHYLQKTASTLDSSANLAPALPSHFQVSGTPAFSPSPTRPPPTIIVPVRYWILNIES